jgi:hypothetical protein
MSQVVMEHWADTFLSYLVQSTKEETKYTVQSTKAAEAKQQDAFTGKFWPKNWELMAVLTHARAHRKVARATLMACEARAVQPVWLTKDSLGLCILLNPTNVHEKDSDKISSKKSHNLQQFVI